MAGKNLSLHQTFANNIALEIADLIAKQGDSIVSNGVGVDGLVSDGQERSEQAALVEEPCL